MTAKKSKKPRDFNSMAAAIVAQATDDKTNAKNPAAVQLGRLGGLKGGKARAKKLTDKQRSDIARKAAAARWSRGKAAS